MDDNRFFRLVWRVNGLILFFAGLLCIVLFGVAAYQLIIEEFGVHERPNIVNIEDNADVKENWTLGYFEDVYGQAFSRIALSSDQRYAQAYYSKSTHSVRNYLYIDHSSEQQHWLLDHNDYLIVESKELSERGYGEDGRTTRVMLYKVVKADSNQDGRLTEADAQIVALSHVDGTGYLEILSDMDEVIGEKLLDAQTLLLLFQRDGNGYMLYVNLLDFSIKKRLPLPKVNAS